MSHEGINPAIAPPKLQLEPKHAPASSIGTGVDEELVLPQLHHQSDTTRRSIIATYWIVVVLCLPIWWNLTSIERLGLPKTRIERLDKEGNKVRQEDLDRPNSDTFNTLEGFYSLWFNVLDHWCCHATLNGQCRLDFDVSVSNTDTELSRSSSVLISSSTPLQLPVSLPMIPILIVTWLGL
jgi:Phosphatidylinositol-glycan biosynthesis class S protein